MQAEHLEHEFTLLANASFYDPQKIDQFVKRLESNTRRVRSEDPKDHYCAFFLPIHILSKKVYLGHHKKATFWIPPGAHIEAGESPRETVKREVKEELQYSVSDEQVSLFDLSVTACHPGSICKVHYDLWYLIAMPDTIDFVFEKREFHDARWVSITDALDMVTFPAYKPIFQRLAHMLQHNAIMK